MKYTIPLSKDKYYKAALSVVNCFFNLTDFELELIVAMLDHDIKTLSKDSRATLRLLLHKDTYVFNNYIKRLKDKKALIESKEGLIINQRIIDSVADTEITIKFNVLEDAHQDH